MLTDYQEFVVAVNENQVRLEFAGYKDWAKKQGWSLGVLGGAKQFVRKCADAEANFRLALN